MHLVSDAASGKGSDPAVTPRALILDFGGVLGHAQSDDYHVAMAAEPGMAGMVVSVFAEKTTIVTHAPGLAFRIDPTPAGRAPAGVRSGTGQAAIIA